MEEIIDVIKCLTNVDNVIEYLSLEKVDILSVIKHAKEKEENRSLIPLLLNASSKIKEIVNDSQKFNLYFDIEKLSNRQQTFDNIHQATNIKHVNSQQTDYIISTGIYVLSDPLNEAASRYKIGSHTGTINKLISRYITPIPELKIYYFVKTLLALDIETYFKKTFADKRIVNINGNKSEWYILSLHDIVMTLNSLLNLTTYQCNSQRQIAKKVTYTFISNVICFINLLKSSEINIRAKAGDYYIKDYKPNGILDVNNKVIAKLAMHNHYVLWCKDANYEPVTPKRFYSEIKTILKDYRMHGSPYSYYIIPNKWITWI